MNKTKTIIFLIIILFFVVGVYFYPQMPAKMASHWNARGEVDGYLTKPWGLFLMPIISLVIALLFLLIPQIDPLKENIIKFRKYFDLFIILIVLFLFYLYILTIFWNLKIRFDFLRMMIFPLSLLFYFVGWLIEKAKRNWFIGIRTPWTLSSEGVWDKTHKLGGKLFKLAGFIVLWGIIFKQYAVWFVVLPIISAALYLFVYSYFEYKKEKH
ncbi:MAG: SdpI family protein [Patescibacteria group bacterium]|nr:SdpI family protein [Patescibacteria group bacterium]MDD5172752.1 SdpI family protein [Patescibacteria group bacterium]